MTEQAAGQAAERAGYQPYEISGAERASRWLVCCDHAANTVPAFVGGGSLGICTLPEGTLLKGQGDFPRRAHGT